MPEGKAALMFKETLITESASHKSYRGSLRSSSKQAPSNPSPNGVRFLPLCKTGPLERGRDLKAQFLPAGATGRGKEA